MRALVLILVARVVRRVVVVPARIAVLLALVAVFFVVDLERLVRDVEARGQFREREVPRPFCGRDDRDAGRAPAHEDLALEPEVPEDPGQQFPRFMADRLVTLEQDEFEHDILQVRKG